MTMGEVLLKKSLSEKNAKKVGFQTLMTKLMEMKQPVLMILISLKTN